MSAFKRYQSKVFWDQMALHDLENNRFVERSDYTGNHLYEENEDEEEEEENLTNKSENDTIDGGDITVIRVYKNLDEDSKQNACWISTIGDESVASCGMGAEETDQKKERKLDPRGRSCSPLSQDLRSQDSGFSDSERSECSEAYENATPRQKLRRKRQRRIRSVITSPWLKEIFLLNPMHTSTPKDSRIFHAARNYFGKSARSLSREQRIDEGRNDVSKISSISLENECLGDFLYASEPPEDSVQPAKSSASIDCVNDAISVGRKVLKSRNYRQSSSMRAWLTDLATQIENECGNALQSKNLPGRKAPVMSEETHTRDLKVLFSAATAIASKLLVSAEQFERHYCEIVEKITLLEGGRSEMGLLRSIEESAFSLLLYLGAPPPRRIQQGSLKSTLAQLQSMKTYVDGTIDTRLDLYIEKIIHGLEEAPWEDSDVVRGALAALTALGLSDPRAGSSIARCSGIKMLLTYLIATGCPASDNLVAATLRALASMCCSATAIEYFVRDSGPEILTNLLAAQSTSGKEKTEATALVVQITAPWINALGLPYLEPYAKSLIPALNQLIESTGCSQTLLLAAAALNHMSKSRLCANIILAEDSVRKLLKSVKKSTTGSNVWLMEQVAALIGELARLPEGRSHMAEARASVALISFLRMRPLGLEDAYRRLEMTATAALTRLCVEPEIARQVVVVGGGNCLPTSDNDEIHTMEEDPQQVEAGLLRYTRSLRRACKKAAKQIGIAKAKDRNALD